MKPPRQIKPTVLEWVPNEQLHWKLNMLGGLVRTIRFFEIEALAETSCIVSNGEIIGGLMGPRLGKRMARTIYRAFIEMNEALKARAEALWQARQDYEKALEASPSPGLASGRGATPRASFAANLPVGSAV